MSKVLLLGAGGFIGSHLCVELLRTQRHEITALDVTSAKIEEGLRQAQDVILDEGETLASVDQLRYFDLDITRPEARARLLELVEEHDVVVNMIAICNPALYVSDPLLTFNVGFVANLPIIDACVARGKRLVHFSTCEVYGKSPAVYVPGQAFHFREDSSDLIMGPVGKQRWIYASGKQLLERVIHAHGLKSGLRYTIIRPFNYIGPRIDYLPSERGGTPRVFSNFIDSLIHGTPLQIVNGGSQRRCYMYIRDATDCHVRIIEDRDGRCDRQIFNVGNPGNETTIRGLAELMCELYREHWLPEGQPLSELRDVPGEQFYGEGYEDIDRRLPVIDKVRSATGWEPRHDLRSTVHETMRYQLQACARRAG